MILHDVLPPLPTKDLPSELELPNMNEHERLSRFQRGSPLCCRPVGFTGSSRKCTLGACPGLAQGLERQAVKPSFTKIGTVQVEGKLDLFLLAVRSEPCAACSPCVEKHALYISTAIACVVLQLLCLRLLAVSCGVLLCCTAWLKRHLKRRLWRLLRSQ